MKQECAWSQPLAEEIQTHILCFARNNFMGEGTGNPRHSQTDGASTATDSARCALQSQVSTGAGRLTWQNVPRPRDRVNAPFRVLGVGGRARVDPWGDPGTHTAGPTCPAQSGCVRMAPMIINGTVRRRAADTSRPGASGNAARGVKATDRPTVEDRYTPIPVPDALPSCPKQGWGAPFPHSHREVVKTPNARIAGNAT